MNLEIETIDNVGIVALPHRLAMANASELREAITAHLDTAEPRLVLDLAAVGFVDSSGLSVLVSALKRARARGGDAVLVHVSEQVMGLIMLTRLHEVFRVYRNLEGAMDGLRATENAA